VIDYVKRREEQLASEDDLSKATIPMDWGLDALLPNTLQPNASPHGQLLDYVTHHRSRSDLFYQPEPTTQYAFSGHCLTFPSHIHTETVENNIVKCQVFEARSRSKAIILLPHWNSENNRYNTLASLLRAVGITTLQMTLPYHEGRRPAHMKSADYLLSANLGRTIRSVRQAVLDCRLAIDWLARRGHQQIGLLGSSLGSAIGFVLTAHEPRIKTAALLLMGSDFADTIWMSRATQHIQHAVRKVLRLEELRQILSIISPTTYVAKIKNRSLPLLLVSGRHDQVCHPHLTQQGIDALAREDLDYTWKVWSCGHYTLGMFPYKFYLAATLMRFFRRTLKAAER
jgi:hypothetical protein